MRTLNRVTLIGHVAADPELRQTKNGTTVCYFPLATNRYLRAGKGKNKEIVDFHRIIVWAKLAEAAKKYLAKGTALYLEGRIVNSFFDDKNKERHYRTEIVADDFNILRWKKGSVDIATIDDGEDSIEVETELV